MSSDEAKSESKRAGRPSDYSQETADKLCSQLAQGISLRTVCKQDDMPSCVTVFAWMRKHPEFLKQYTRAKEESADALIEDIQEISDAEPYMIVDEKGIRRYDSACVNWQRLRVDSRKWVASKLKPKKYGERLQHANDEENPMPQMILYCPKEEKEEKEE